MDIKPMRKPQQPVVGSKGPAPAYRPVSAPQPVRRPVVQTTPQPVQPQAPRPVQPRPQSQPVSRPSNPVSAPPVQPPPPQPPVSQPVEPPKSPKEPRKKGKKKVWLYAIGGLLLLAALVLGGIFFWYQTQLAPANPDNTEKVLVKVPADTSPSGIANILEENGVIKNKTAFSWYTRINGVQNQLQAGAYRLSPSESTPEIVDHLVKGSVDTFSITFYPGATLVDNVTKAENRIDVTTVLRKAGYGPSEIAAALNKTYDHPLFQDKPANTDLEGYVFGETYQFNSGSTVEDILTRTFDEFYKYIVQDNLIDAYEEQGLNLYEGITLASIVQRESGGDDKAQIAQVFYSRMAINMPLGSDVTYQYIADKTGVTRDPNLDSPYNTRRYVGLPPGPIAVPGLAALRAVAKPAAGDYLYFLSGDDHVTYYGRTLDEHEANIVNHCQEKCKII